jgi:hypothetical protein
MTQAAASLWAATGDRVPNRPRLLWHAIDLQSLHPSNRGHLMLREWTEGIRLCRFRAWAQDSEAGIRLTRESTVDRAVEWLG